MTKGSDNFYKTILPNGMTLLFEKRKVPITSTIAATRFGGAYESDKIKGIAHFIEHSVFETTKRTSKEINLEIEKKGGEWNAFTSEEETAFWIKMDSKHFDLSMDIISDIMLHPAFTDKNFKKEKGIILQEIKMYHDLPNYHVLDRLKDALYQKPFAIPIIGTEKIISTVPKKTLMDYHNQYYVPSNMVLSVSGKAEFDEVKIMAQKYFQKKSSNQKFSIPFKITSLNSTKEFVEKRKNLDQAHLALGFTIPTRMDKGRYSSEVLNASLGVGMSSPLVQEIREKRGLAYSVRSDLDQGNNFGYCYVYAGIRKDAVKEVKEIILREIKKLSSLQKRDFEETKEQLIGRYYLDMENSMKTAQNLMYEELTAGAEEYYHYPERISEVRLADVRGLSKIKKYGYVAVVPE